MNKSIEEAKKKYNLRKDGIKKKKDAIPTTKSLRYINITKNDFPLRTQSNKRRDKQKEEKKTKSKQKKIKK